MKTIRLICVLVIFRYMTVSAATFNPERDTLALSFSQAEEMLYKENVFLKRQEAEVAVSEAEARQERLFENPEISIQHNINNPVTGRYFECGEEGQSDIQISQRIYIGGQRAEKVRLAKANLGKAKAESADTKRLLCRDLYSTMAEVFYFQKKIDILNEEIKVIDKILLPYERQHQKGNISAIELLRMRSQIVQLQKEIKEIEVAMLTNQNELQLMLGVSENIYIDPLIDENEMLEMSGKLNLQDIMSDIDTRPDLERARRSVEMAEHNVKLQKANALPELSLNGEWDKNGNIGHNYFGAGITLTMPIFNRNQGLIRAARVELESRMIEKEYLQKEIANEKILNWNCIQKLHDTVEESGSVAEEMSVQILDKAQQQYLKHNISLLELIDHLDTYKDVQFSFVDNKLELVKKIVSLDIYIK